MIYYFRRGEIKLKKIILSILLVILLLTGCGGEKISQQELITEYVKSNEEKLLEVLSEINLEEELDAKDIISKLPKDIKIVHAYNSNNSCVEFGIDEGETTSSHYYGFYYTPLDKPLAAGMEDKRLEEYGKGYKIQVPGNEDWYYTEKIVDNFYFYEDHY